MGLKLAAIFIMCKKLRHFFRTVERVVCCYDAQKILKSKWKSVSSIYVPESIYSFRNPFPTEYKIFLFCLPCPNRHFQPSFSVNIPPIRKYRHMHSLGFTYQQPEQNVEIVKHIFCIRCWVPKNYSAMQLVRDHISTFHLGSDKTQLTF